MVRVKLRASKETRQPVELAEAIRRSLSTEKITQRPPMARIKPQFRRANVVPVDRRRDWPVESNNINNINAGYWEKAFILFLIEKKVRINFKTPNPKRNRKNEIIYEEFMHCKTMDQLKNYGVPNIRHDIRKGYLVIHKDDLRKRWDEYKDDDDNVPEEKFKNRAKKARDLIATGEWPRGDVKGFPYGPFLATDEQKKASYPYENEEDDEEEPAPAPDDEDDDEDYSENIQAPDPAPDDDEDEDDYEEDEEDEEPGETQQEEVPYPSNEDEGEEERAIVEEKRLAPAPDDDDDEDDDGDLEAAQNALKRKRKIEEIILVPESKKFDAAFLNLKKGELSRDDFLKRVYKYEKAKKKAKKLEIALA